MWLLFAESENKYCVGIAFFIIIVMLVSAIFMWQFANRAKVNLLENVLLRQMLSLYAGWLLSATAISAIFYFD